MVCGLGATAAAPRRALAALVVRLATGCLALAAWCSRSRSRYETGVSCLAQPPQSELLRRVVAVHAPRPCPQLIVAPVFDDTAAIDDQHFVGVLDRGQSVRDDERRPAFEQMLQRLLDECFRFGVERRGGLVQDEDGRVLEERTGDGEALLLAAGEPEAPLTDLGLVAPRQPCDELAGEREPGGICKVGVRGVGSAPPGLPSYLPRDGA